MLLAVRLPQARLTVAIIAGVLWASGWAHWSLAWPLPDNLEHQDLVLTGRVAGLPVTLPEGVRFLLTPAEVKSLDGTNWPHPGQVRLTWRHPRTPPQPGEPWQLRVRLQRPHGFMNPGGFDYEAWLFQAGLRATGYVLPHGDNQRLGASQGEWVNRWRLHLRAALQQGAEQRPFQGVITALVMGDQHDITQAQWQVFNVTGTSHLIAISGLHVGLLAALGYVLLRYPWSVTRWVLRVPAPRVGAIGGFTCAAAYTALAGFAVPTVRTLIMLGVGFLGQWQNRRWSAVDALLIALTLILLMDPTAGILPGFWLSFGAVALIFYAMRGRTGTRDWWWRWGRLHWVIALGLTPMLVYWFGQNPTLGPLANVFAVPWVSFLVVPLALLGAALLGWWAHAAQALLQAADWALGVLWLYLQWLAGLDVVAWSRSMPPLWVAVAATVGAALLLAPRGLPGRWLGGVWLLPLLVNRPGTPPETAFRFTLLDVGQGLASVVETARHTLIFDCGGRFSDNFDAGRAIVAVYLKQTDRERIDAAVISTDRSDHWGGCEGVLADFRVDAFYGNVPARFGGRSVLPCGGPAWVWDGVQFEWIAAPDKRRAGAPCALRVSNGRRSVLLTGDLRRRDENDWVQQPALNLAADIVVVPAHGSRTASSRQFIEAVGPDYALISAGYRNRYGHPHADVVAGYAAAGAQVLVTATTGAITFDVGAEVSPPAFYRRSARRFWNVPLPENTVSR